MCHGPRHTHMGVILIPCLGQRCDWLESAHDGDPVAHGRLPFIEILATNIGTIDDLVAIAHGTKHLHTHGRLHNGREAAGHRAKLEADIGNILALREPQRSGIQAQGIVVGGQQVTGQSPVS